MNLPRPSLAACTAAILLCAGCGGGSNFETPEDPTRPTLTVTTTGITLSGSLTPAGATPLVTGTTAELVTVGGDSPTNLSGERATINKADKSWSYTLPTLPAADLPKKVYHVRYWYGNQLLKTESVTVTIPAP